MTDTEKHPLVERLRNALTEIDGLKHEVKRLRKERDHLMAELVLARESLHQARSKLRESDSA